MSIQEEYDLQLFRQELHLAVMSAVHNSGFKNTSQGLRFSTDGKFKMLDGHKRCAIIIVFPKEKAIKDQAADRERASKLRKRAKQFEELIRSMKYTCRTSINNMTQLTITVYVESGEILT